MTKKISELNNISIPALTDAFETAQSSAIESRRITTQQVLDCIEPELQLTPQQIIGTAITMADSTDILPQGLNNFYLTNDGGVTDNLEEMPTIVGIETELSNKLDKTNNLSDVSNIVTSAQNIGVQNGYIYVISSQVLTSPLPININIGVTASSQVIQLPDATTLNPNFVGRQIFINNYSTFDVTIVDGTASPINGGNNTVKASTNYFLRPDDRGTVAGIWYLYPFVQEVNGKNGIADISLQSAYDYSSSTPTLNLTNNGLGIYNNDFSHNFLFRGDGNGNITYGNFFVEDSSGDVFNVDGVSLIVTLNSNPGVLGAVGQLLFYGNTYNTVGQEAFRLTPGFNGNVVGQPDSSYAQFEIIDANIRNTVFSLYGTDSNGGPRAQFGGTSIYSTISSISINASSINPNALFQIDSVTQGQLIPRWTGLQETTNIATLGTGDNGLNWYNSTYGVIAYWDSVDLQYVLNANSVLAGTNVTVTNNNNGTITIDSSGGGTGGESGQAGFNFINNTNQTTFTSTIPVPIVMSSATYMPVTANNFAVTLSGGTVDIQNQTANTVNTQFSFNINLIGTTSTPNTYIIWAFTKTGSTSTPTFYRATITLTDNVTPYTVPISGIVILPSMSSLQFYISNISALSPVNVRDITGEVLDTTQLGGLSSTDSLSQGSNNLYLSTNGGTTYQNTFGILTPNHIVTFATSGGLLQDGGPINSSATKFASDNTKSFVASVSAATVSGNLLKAADTAGTVQDSGIAATSVATAITSSTVTTSTQTAAVNNRYYVNYAGGQCVFTLPTATGTNAIVEIIGITTASTSGWKANAQSTDKIEFTNTLGALGGSLTSTAGSATDCATLRDIAANLWVVYPALGLNLTVA